MTTDENPNAGTIIFRTRGENATNEIAQKFYARRKLTDFGDHVEWTDGKKIWKWRMPDQIDGPAEYPILKHILFVPNHPAIPLPIKTFRVAFIDANGNILTHISTRNPILPEPLLDEILPNEEYAQLEKRGVTRITESYRNIKLLYAAHPDPSLNVIARGYARHPVVWVVVAMAVIIGVSNIILLLTGYYN